jgi:hypothetical protein
MNAPSSMLMIEHCPDPLGDALDAIIWIWPPDKAQVAHYSGFEEAGRGSTSVQGYAPDRSFGYGKEID